MRMSPLRRAKPASGPGVSGTVRLDKRTRNLAKRLRPGDIAIIDHVDLDRVSAEALVSCDVAAVINVSESISGRYPNLGPQIIAAAGIPLVDNVGADVFASLDEGDRVLLRGGAIHRGEQSVGHGEILDRRRVDELMAAARSGLSTQLEAFSANTIEYVRREHSMLLDGEGLPDLRTQMADRHVVVVVRGYDYRDELASLRSYIRDYRPVLIGVDGGADALLESGHRPDIVLGSMETVSDSALRSGAELVLHTARDGRSPSAERLANLALEAAVLPANGASEDAAVLLADFAGAELIVAVGTHATLEEFLDKGRSGMASTFLTRLRVGSKLVDARAVERLHRTGVRTWQLVLLLLAGMVCVAVAVAATPVGSDWFADLWTVLDDWVQGLLG